MKRLSLDARTGLGRFHPMPALVLGGALIVTSGLAGCQKSGNDATMNEAPYPAFTETRDSTPPAPESPAHETATLPAAPVTPITPKSMIADSMETWTLAMTAYREARYEDARSLFREVVAAKPDQGFARAMLGVSAWKSGDMAEAETELRAALTADQTNDRARFNLARVLLDTKRPGKALDLVASRRDNAEALRLAARARHQEGLFEEALATYRNALALDDRDVWSMNNMALIHIEHERFEEALPPLARAVELRGDVATFRNNLGVALERAENYAAAAEQYAAAVNLDSSYDRAEVSRQRVAALAGASRPAPDLALLADEFEAAIGAWRNSEMAGRAEDPN